LDAGVVCRTRHESAQGIDLADQVALADAADGGVATHLPQGFQIMGEQQGAAALASTGQGGLGAGMAAANDDDIEGFWMVHGIEPMGQLSARKGFNLKGIDAAAPEWASLSSGITQNSFFDIRANSCGRRGKLWSAHQREAERDHGPHQIGAGQRKKLSNPSG
jgi:hypothetical protein